MTFHILEHYRFNRDPQILSENWDLLTASTEFCESYLIPSPDGTLMARPASSPENMFFYVDKNGVKQKAALSAGTSVEQFLILQVFNDYVEAARVLGKMEEPLVKRVQEILPKSIALKSERTDVCWSGACPSKKPVLATVTSRMSLAPIRAMSLISMTTPLCALPLSNPSRAHGPWRSGHRMEPRLDHRHVRAFLKWGKCL